MEWMGGMLFHTRTPSGHDVFLDSSKDVGGADTAPRPMEMMLISLMGCTGMDVVSILRKMRVELKSLRLGIEYDRRPYHPRIYTKVKIRYIFELDEDDPPMEKLEKAVRLSQEKYCSASAIIKNSVNDFKYEIVVENSQKR